MGRTLKRNESLMSCLVVMIWGVGLSGIVSWELGAENEGSE